MSAFREMGERQRAPPPDIGDLPSARQTDFMAGQQNYIKEQAAIAARISDPRLAEIHLQRTQEAVQSRVIDNDRNQLIMHVQEGATKGWWGPTGDPSEVVQQLQSLDPADPRSAAEIETVRKAVREARETFVRRGTLDAQAEEDWAKVRQQVTEMVAHPDTDYDPTESMSMHRAMNAFRTGIYETEQDYAKARTALDEQVERVRRREADRRLGSRPGSQRQPRNMAALEREAQEIVISEFKIQPFDDAGDPNPGYESALEYQIDLLSRAYNVVPGPRGGLAPLLGPAEERRSRQPVQNGQTPGGASAPKGGKGKGSALSPAKIKRLGKAKSYEDVLEIVGGEDAINSLSTEEKKRILDAVQGR